MNNHAAFAFFLTFALSALGQSSVESLQNSEVQSERRNFRVVDRGQNHRTVAWEMQHVTQDGRIATEPHGFTELAAGLHYRQNGEWLETKEEFELVPGWAVARKGPHKISLAQNLNSAGSVAVELPDGRVVRSHVVGLAYLDSGSGQHVMLGLVKDCSGTVLPPNVVLYENVFDNVKCDVRYTYRRGGVSQDIILRERLPEPQALGLDPATTRLTVFTEFVSGPEPIVEADAPAPAPKAAAANTIATQNDDIVLKFGEMCIGKGKAFKLGEKRSPVPSKNQVPVFKRWVEQGGRKFLFEEVPVLEIQEDLEKLPQQSSVLKNEWTNSALANLNLPPKGEGRVVERDFEVAMTIPASAGYVIDYELMGAALTNFTFKADTTYYVNGEVNLTGVTTIEGNTVIKFNPTTAGFIYVASGTVDCKTGPYRPAVFTSKNDNTVGETISGSTGAPNVNEDQNYYFASSASNLDLHDIRMSYTYCGITLMDGSATLRNIQMLHAAWPFWIVNASSCRIQNLLMHDVMYGFEVSQTPVSVEHMTLNDCEQLGANDFAASLAMTNCLLVGVQYLGNIPLSTNCVTMLSSSNGVFQTVGGGFYYLATNSPYRDVGTTNISPALLADLSKKTTWPPLVFSNLLFSVPTNIAPQATRDTAIPDLGYHYDPLDYVFGGCVLSTNMTIASNTVVSWFEGFGSVYAYGQPYGMALNNGAKMLLQGSVLKPTHVVRFNVVQEGIGSWSSRGWMCGFMFNGSASSPRPQISANFTKWYGALGYAGPFRDKWSYGDAYNANGEFWAATIATYGASTYFTNCLFDRAGLYFFGDTDATSITFLNCTLREGAMIMKRYSGRSPSFWRVESSAFDGVNLTTYDQLNANPNSTYMDYNAFNPNNTNWMSHPFIWYGAPKTNVLEVAGPHDVTVTSFNWQSGALGGYYLPTNSLLINAGSATAVQLGLMYYTTQTNQTQELFSMVDIGYHYPALDGNGSPVDSDSDFLLDAWELAYFGSLSQTGSGDYDGDGVSNYLEWAQGRNPTVYGAAADGGNATKLIRFTPLK